MSGPSARVSPAGTRVVVVEQKNSICVSDEKKLSRSIGFGSKMREMREIPLRELRYSQSSISAYFKDGRRLETLMAPPAAGHLRAAGIRL